MNQVNNIFDSMMKFSEINHKTVEIRELKQSVYHSKKSCGSCYHWMTQQCPNETPRNKVTCNGRICGEFKISSLSQKIINGQEEKIVKLESELKTLRKRCQ